MHFSSSWLTCMCFQARQRLLPSRLRVGRALRMPVAVSDSTRGLSQLSPGGVETVPQPVASEVGGHDQQGDG